ncbi:FAD-binding oxidoreductase [Paraburkholderia humisilvae]|uniref:Putative FAD-linked oxidoreductase YvdP n=1 Tax=Paraburkholderia humisilvae TaxID=627669 RepID=A0A6J5D9R4_9BURK|nr:FAD-binding oxidoreductase [Paraburkholderia humisilvae]CAB3750988.1 putative FAD-linked oxidoreductase YvdP [Paraburkholderia humisilvae]
MRTATLKRLDGTSVDPAVIVAFRKQFKGKSLMSGDEGYEKARAIWNANIDKRPGLIACCTSVADVIDSVKFARENDLLVAVKSGGHNVAGRSLCDDGIVIDLSAMNRVSVNPTARTVDVQGGALLADLDRETHPYGLAVPSGVVSATGIAGLTLGGGVGWLVRRYGMTIDNLLSCEVVTANGEFLTASADTNADLFWGLRGGGGNFGIVTSFTFRAHPVKTVLGGVLLYPRADARSVLRHYRDFMTTAPEELTAYAVLMSTPEGVPAVGLLVCYCSDVSEGERVLAPLRQFGTPMQDAIEPMPFPVMQSLLEQSPPDVSHAYWKSTFVKALGDDTIDLLIEHMERSRSPLTATVVEYYAGAPTRIDRADTAFSQRAPLYNINIATKWRDPAESDQHIGWTRALFDALRPHSNGGYLPNFFSDEVPDQSRIAYGSNYARLAELKAKYDPTNFFSLNQNVKPTQT